MRRPGLVPGLLCLAYALLLAAWVWGNPPFASPDEWSHYLRAIGVGQVQLIGRHATFPTPPGASTQSILVYRWINQADRTVVVPPGLYGVRLDCDAQHPDESAACLHAVHVITVAGVQATPVGNYQPLPYVLPGLLIHLAADPFSGNWWGRVGASVSCLICVALAIWFLWDGTALSLLGLLVAATPMVLFLGASLNPSGLEIFAGIAFAAAVLRLARRAEASRAVWLIAGAVGFVLALTRSPAPLWLLLDGLVLIALLGFGRFWRELRRGGWAATVALVTVAFGMGLNELWEHAYGSHLLLTLPAFIDQLGHGVDRLQYLMQEEVGVFGSLDTPLRLWMYRVWWGVSAGLVLGALWVGTPREQWTVLGALVGILVVSVVFSALLTAGTGFDVQGRHMLPLVVMLPLLAGEVVRRHRPELNSVLVRVLPALVALLVATVQFGAWYWNAYRQSVGEAGPILFLRAPQWSPPLGWLPWILLAAGGGALLGLAIALPLAPDPIPRWLLSGDGGTQPAIADRGVGFGADELDRVRRQ